MLCENLSGQEVFFLDLSTLFYFFQVTLVECLLLSNQPRLAQVTLEYLLNPAKKAADSAADKYDQSLSLATTISEETRQKLQDYQFEVYYVNCVVYGNILFV
jgi:hypothetical protein